MNAIGSDLERVRRQTGLAQEDVADQLGVTDVEKMGLRLLWMRRRIPLYLWSSIIILAIITVLLSVLLVSSHGDPLGLWLIALLSMLLAVLAIGANRIIEIFLRCPICGFRFNGSLWKNLIVYFFPAPMQLEECAVCAVRPDAYLNQPGEREAFSLLKRRILRGFGIAWILLVAVLIIESLRQVVR
jgi:hypothetical protein